MRVGKFLLSLLLLPGNLVLNGLGITVEQDAGIFRSFVNSSVWGVVALLVTLMVMG
ncbi:MAG: hypothetical protein AAF468_08415 [Pseudomonadota bacterium]